MLVEIEGNLLNFKYMIKVIREERTVTYSQCEGHSTVIECETVEEAEKLMKRAAVISTGGFDE